MAAAGTEHVLVVLARTKRKRRMGLQMGLRVPSEGAIDCTQIPSPLQVPFTQDGDEWKDE